MSGDIGDKAKKKDNLWWQPALFVFFKLSSLIAAPIIAGLYTGRMLDNKYGTEPKLFLITMGAAFFLSMFGIAVIAFRESKKMKNVAKFNHKNQEKNKKTD